jgi:hypothetical protein
MKKYLLGTLIICFLLSCSQEVVEDKPTDLCSCVSYMTPSFEFMMENAEDKIAMEGYRSSVKKDSNMFFCRHKLDELEDEAKIYNKEMDALEEDEKTKFIADKMNCPELVHFMELMTKIVEIQVKELEESVKKIGADKQ